VAGLLGVSAGLDLSLCWFTPQRIQQRDPRTTSAYSLEKLPSCMPCAQILLLSTASPIYLSCFVDRKEYRIPPEKGSKDPSLCGARF
jgi:hypothetical protein